jgi:hypothetical protein
MGSVMQSAGKFREYADECMQWAKKAKSDAEREAFLEMAEAWLQAAMKLEPPPKSHTLIDSRWLLRAEARRPIRPHHRIVAKAIIEIALTGEQIGPPSQE